MTEIAGHRTWIWWMGSPYLYLQSPDLVLLLRVGSCGFSPLSESGVAACIVEAMCALRLLSVHYMKLFLDVISQPRPAAAEVQW